MAMRACASVLLLTWASTAGAEGNRPDWAFGEPAAEIGVAGVAAASNLTLLLDQNRSSWGPSHVQEFDPTIGAWSDLFGAAGGVLAQLGAGYAIEAGYLATVRAADPGVDALFGGMVEAEAVLLSTGLTTFLKRLTGRCRPRAERDGFCTEHDAFPSGHTSAISPFAGARLVRLVETPPEGRGVRALGYALAELGTVTTATLRVTAGAHSWEDVLVGALLGHATGLLVALAHPPIDVAASPAARASAAIRDRGPSPRVSVTFAF